jgi:hypothetical protein
MRKQIIYRLTRNLILAFFISCVLTSLLILICYNNNLGSLEGNSGVALFIIGGCISSLVLTILSTTVYLNIFDKIRADSVHSFLTFFLLPTLFTIAIIVCNIDSDIWLLYLILTLPFIMIQIYFYRDYKKVSTKVLEE